MINNITDDTLEKLKNFFSSFPDLESFKRGYIDVYKPSNVTAIIELFEATKGNSEVWQLYKYLVSKETLRIDKILKGTENITIEDIIKTINKYEKSKYKRVIIKLDNQNYEDIDKLLGLGIDVYISVAGDRGLCTIEEFKIMREFFNDFRQNTLSYNLSDLEKITLAYDHVKFFLYNKEQSDKLSDSRSIVKSISTGNIVCEGYCRILCQLLKELGLNSNLVFIEPTMEENSGHVRVILRVVDKKYNIDGIFVFDPTYDSSMDMALVQHSDESLSYETKSKQKEDDTVVEKMPSDIRYLFYMIPIEEYKKYFKGEKIKKIVKYPSGERIELSEDLITVLEYDDQQPRNDFIMDILPDLLLKVKKIEGYSNEQIENNIVHSMNILKQDRYGRFDKYGKKGNAL